MIDFVALDFETADPGRDSACALALAVVRDGRVAETWCRLIRPPRPVMHFTHIHGITWEQVADQPDFGALWPDISGLIAQAPFLAAHNAPFDRGVLAECCRAHGHPSPLTPFVCTVRAARETWNLRPTRLPDALSDAVACAEILLAARRDGYDPRRQIPGH